MYISHSPRTEFDLYIKIYHYLYISKEITNGHCTQEKESQWHSERGCYRQEPEPVQGVDDDRSVV